MLLCTKRKQTKTMRYWLFIKDEAIVSKVDFVMFTVHKNILKNVQLDITSRVCPNDAIIDDRHTIFLCIKKNKLQHETTFYTGNTFSDRFEDIFKTTTLNSLSNQRWKRKQ